MRLIIQFIKEFFRNPSEGFIILKMMIIGSILIILGCVGVGAHECSKKILDKIKMKG